MHTVSLLDLLKMESKAVRCGTHRVDFTVKAFKLLSKPCLLAEKHTFVLAALNRGSHRTRHDLSDSIVSIDHGALNLLIDLFDLLVRVICVRAKERRALTHAFRLVHS